MDEKERISMINQRPLLKRMSSGAKWINQDEFPSNAVWADEVEKWLEFLNKQGQFARFLPRLKDDAKARDEALAEIAAAYYIKKKIGYKIVEWEPIGCDNKNGEFLIETPFSKKIFCEVKSPGWEADICRKEGPNSQRLKEKKHKSGTGGFYSNYPRIREAIDKAYSKFPTNRPTLLIIVDDLMVSLFEALGSPGCDPFEKALYEKGKGYFKTDKYKNLGAIAALQVVNRCPFDKINYDFVFYRNRCAKKLNRIPFYCFFKYDLEASCRRIKMIFKTWYWKLRGPKVVKLHDKDLRKKLKYKKY